jgi:hypothetical protein
MNKECAAIVHLREMAQMDGDNQGSNAETALLIIADVREYYLSETDIKYLHSLTDEIIKSGHKALLAYLSAGVPDCDICAALMVRMAALTATPLGQARLR